MGDISELMIEGFLCQGCGIVIDETSPGHPRKCMDCKVDRLRSTPRNASCYMNNETACQHCGTVGENKIGPGKGPHAGALICTACGKWIKWLSKSFIKSKGNQIV